MIIGFVIWSIVAACFAAIGIGCRKSGEAVGFFTFAEPPTVAAENVKKYNHAVSALWIFASAILEMIGTPLLFAQQNSPAIIVIVFAVMLLVIVMTVVFTRIEAKYKV